MIFMKFSYFYYFLLNKSLFVIIKFVICLVREELLNLRSFPCALEAAAQSALDVS